MIERERERENSTSMDGEITRRRHAEITRHAAKNWTSPWPTNVVETRARWKRRMHRGMLVEMTYRAALVLPTLAGVSIAGWGKTPDAEAEATATATSPLSRLNVAHSPFL